MYFKVLCYLAVIAATWAHEEPYSSVYITKADDHPEIIRHRHHDHHDDHDHHGHHGHHGHHDDHIDYYTYPKYEFEYKVRDHHTGDIKSQHAILDGAHFKGYYRLHQPDGLERVVHYYGDDKTGFHADVKYSTHHHIPEHKYHHH